LHLYTVNVQFKKVIQEGYLQMKRKYGSQIVHFPASFIKNLMAIYIVGVYNMFSIEAK